LLVSMKHIAIRLNYIPSSKRVVLVDQKFNCSNFSYNFTSKFVWENSEIKFLPTAVVAALNGMKLTLKQQHPTSISEIKFYDIHNAWCWMFKYFSVSMQIRIRVRHTILVGSRNDRRLAISDIWPSRTLYRL
jgi:hypothetical protein